MLIELQDIQKIRSVASNIDIEKINNYIREAERLDLIPVITYDLYKRLDGEGVEAIEVGVDRYGIAELLADEQGNPIVVEGENTTAQHYALGGHDHGGAFESCGWLCAQFVSRILKGV